MAIFNPPTLADLEGPRGPFLLEVKLGAATGQPRWVLQQSVKDADEGLAVASRLCQSYDYRLFLGQAWGYLYLEWVGDAPDSDYCAPAWVRR